MTEFPMPSLGADMEAATLVEWQVSPGDRVRKGDIIAAVETDKGVIDIEIFEDAVIETLVAGVNEKVAVGETLATYRRGDEAAPESAPARPRISPAARRRAAELGIAPEQAAATGPGGSITLADIERAAEATGAPAATTPAGQANAPDMRRAIAAAMARSKREIPHYYLSNPIDLTRTLAWLARENEQRPLPRRLVYGVLLIKAVALALKQMPDFNGFWRADAFAPSADIHIGVAVSLRQGGLVAPALHHADSKDLDTLMREFFDLVARVRSGRMRHSELSAATVTVSSLGEQGVETVYPIINPPQVAAIGFGSIVERPWCVDGQIEARRLITATLAADHRASDGHRGARLLQHIDHYLQEPEQLCAKAN